MRLQLFSGKYPPACKYCEKGMLTSDNGTVICAKHGSVKSDFSCRSYLYAPLKRMPKSLPMLPIYNEKDFEL